MCSVGDGGAVSAAAAAGAGQQRNAGASRYRTNLLKKAHNACAGDLFTNAAPGQHPLQAEPNMHKQDTLVQEGSYQLHSKHVCADSLLMSMQVLWQCQSLGQPAWSCQCQCWGWCCQGISAGGHADLPAVSNTAAPSTASWVFPPAVCNQ